MTSSPEDVFVFTPQGNVKELPFGSTPVDFAYSIHTDVGHRCAGAKVDARIVPLKHRLTNGNVVEIITNKNHRPNKDWLDFVVTSRARTKIRHWLRSEEQEAGVALGKEIIEKELKKYDIEYGSLVRSGELEKVAKDDFGLHGLEALQMNLGYGKISAYKLLTKLLPKDKLAKLKAKKISRFRKVLDKFTTRTKATTGGVVVKGVDNVMVNFPRCCNPLPGDPIVGFISHGQGVTVHSAKCRNLLNVDPERRIDVEWARGIDVTRPVKIRIVSENVKGMLAKISDTITNMDSNVKSANIKTLADSKALNIFEVEVKDTKHLKLIIKALQKIKKINKVERVKY